MDRTVSTASDVEFRRVTDRFRHSQYINQEFKQHDMWDEQIPEFINKEENEPL